MTCSVLVGGLPWYPLLTAASTYPRFPSIRLIKIENRYSKTDKNGCSGNPVFKHVRPEHNLSV